MFCLCVQLESDLLLSDVVISYGAQVTNIKNYCRLILEQLACSLDRHHPSPVLQGRIQCTAAHDLDFVFLETLVADYVLFHYNKVYYNEINFYICVQKCLQNKLLNSEIVV